MRAFVVVVVETESGGAVWRCARLRGCCGLCWAVGQMEISLKSVDNVLGGKFVC